MMVEHPEFGIGQIVEIDCDTGDPSISVRWNDGQRGCYLATELEFLVTKLKGRNSND